MRPNLVAWASSDSFLDFQPIFPVESYRVDKALMLFVAPAALANDFLLILKPI